jgi:hypothetical protein
MVRWPQEFRVAVTNRTDMSFGLLDAERSVTFCRASRRNDPSAAEARAAQILTVMMCIWQ